MSIIVVACCAFLAASGEVDAGRKIEPGIFRIDGIEEGQRAKDLRVFRKALRGVSVIGLGEDVHTTRGFSRLKFRLFEYLVEEMDFRVFGFESPWVEAERVARYVETCSGTPTEALTGLFGVWQNESVRDLVAWMCEYNRDHPGDPVHFYGFDHQQGWNDGPRLKNLLRRFGVKESSKKIRWIDDCEGATSDSAGDYFGDRQMPVPEEPHLRCLAALDQNWKFLEKRRRKLIRKGLATARDIEWAKIHIVGLRSFQEQIFYQDSAFNRAFEARDLGMAYIARMIRELRFPNAKTALWAHNGHIAAGDGLVRGAKPMGSFLKADLGSDYEAVALVAFESKIDWPGVGCGSTGESTVPSFEARLRDFREPYLFVDLDFPGTDTPFLEPGRFQVLSDGNMQVRNEFRALFYMEVAEKMVPLAWEPCTE